MNHQKISELPMESTWITVVYHEVFETCPVIQRRLRSQSTSALEVGGSGLRLFATDFASAIFHYKTSKSISCTPSTAHQSFAYYSIPH